MLELNLLTGKTNHSLSVFLEILSLFLFLLSNDFPKRLRDDPLLMNGTLYSAGQRMSDEEVEDALEKGDFAVFTQGVRRLLFSIKPTAEVLII
jgi:hypothetical protein